MHVFDSHAVEPGEYIHVYNHDFQPDSLNIVIQQSKRRMDYERWTTNRGREAKETRPSPPGGGPDPAAAVDD